MTQTLTPEQTLVEQFRTLTPQQQQEVITFIEFLQFKEKQQKTMIEEEKQISAYEAAQKWIGCVDSGIGDLSYNKKYLSSPIKS